jgi:hypothetical protein
MHPKTKMLLRFLFWLQWATLIGLNPKLSKHLPPPTTEKKNSEIFKKSKLSVL